MKNQNYIVREHIKNNTNTTIKSITLMQEDPTQPK